MDMKKQIAERWLDLGIGHSQRIQEAYVEDGKIVLGLMHAYDITLTPEQASNLVGFLQRTINEIETKQP